MPFFSRLIRIIRARLHHDHNGDPLNGNGYWQAGDDAGEERTNCNSQSEDHRHGLDTRLAGYYANLEVPYGSDLGTVQQAWKRLVRKYHPDIHSEDPDKRRVANELTKGLNPAYEKLAKHLKK